MSTQSRKHRRTRAVLAVAAAALVPLVGGLSLADVVLHPGTVYGPIGLTGWSFTSGSVQISGNASGFSASASYTGDAYSLTVESDQSYSNMYAYQYYPGGYFFLQSRASRTVPLNGSVQADLRRPGGAIAGSVRLLNNPPVGAIPVVAEVSYVRFEANAENSALQESYRSYLDKNAAGGTLPMAAAASVTVTGYARIAVTDAAGRACTIQRNFPVQVVGVAAGATAGVVEDIDVTDVTCAAPLSGVLSVGGLPGGVAPYYAYVYTYSPIYMQSNILSGNGQTFAFPGLPAGRHYVQAQAYFGAPYNGGLTLPHGGVPYVDLPEGTSVTRDYVFDGAVAAGALEITGVGAGRAYYGQMNFRGTGAETSGGQAYSNVTFTAGTRGEYQTVVTAGAWQPYYQYVAFRDATGTSYSQVQVQDYGSASETYAPGAVTTRPTQTLETSDGLLVFDVIEPPGSPVIGISYPSVNARRSVPGTSRYVYLYGNTSVTDAPTPAVRLIGPPGRYDFDAYATVRGSNTRFASASIDLGQNVNTPPGTNVTVVLKDSTGADLPVTLVFGTVTTGGSTTASVTSIGPGLPADYRQVAIVSGQSYLSVNTSVTATGAVEVRLTYDQAALGLTDAQERTLTLLHYECTSGGSCAWRPINTAGRTNPDAATNTLYGTVDGATLTGLYALATPVVTLVPPSSTCVGAASEPAQLTTAAGVCAVTVDNTNQLAGGCEGGGGGLLSCLYDGAASQTLSPGTHALTIVGTATDTATSTCTSHVRVVDREAPVLGCPAPVTVECAGATTPASLAASCADNCAASCAATCGAGPFAPGTTPATCSATDAAGNTASCETSVTVRDTTAPALAVTASPAVLWPPNHRLRPVALRTTFSDVCDPSVRVACTATSSEPDDGLGDGDTRGDIEWRGGELFLRAERAGLGTSRVYTITCTATDASGNRQVRTTTVTVPHDES